CEDHRGGQARRRPARARSCAVISPSFVPAQAVVDAHKFESTGGSRRERERRDCALSPCGRGRVSHVNSFERVRGLQLPYPSPVRDCGSTELPSPARGEGIAHGIRRAESSFPCRREVCASLKAEAEAGPAGSNGIESIAL